MKLPILNWPKFNLATKWNQLKENFFIQDGQKRKLNFKFIGVVILPLIVAGVVYRVFHSQGDSSYLNQTSERATPLEQTFIIKNEPSRKNSLIHEVSEAREPSKLRSIVKYSAKQVISRNGGDGSVFIRVGTNFIAKLLTSIDTRDHAQMIKVLLPYGGIYKGEKTIDPGSLLLGSAQYAGSGDKVFITFYTLVNPDGDEYRIQAQALTSKDFSSGLSGDVHSNFDGRMMTSVGLSMLSAGSDVLVEKESLGHSFEPTPKSNLKNATMAGVSRATQAEAERKVSQTGSEEDYVTVESGTELIVSLTETFRGESIERK
ncbi:MAG: hypothetical protein JWQ35_2681 [Bacteriovoracaceae bacterium]|nr:hypothetical protein [Bacteriovoracaceae bacterium]